MTLAGEKIAARKAAEAARADGATAAGGQWLAAGVAAAAADLGLARGPRRVSAVWSMGTEIDTRPLVDWLLAAGHELLLPVVAAKATPLVFRRWCHGEPLVPGGFGTSIPAPEAPEMAPEILFVPLLSFDDDGYRLGYGGGFYDRTLEALRAAGDVVAVGIGYAAQRVDRVLRGPHDQRLDWLATDEGVRRVGGGQE